MIKIQRPKALIVDDEEEARNILEKQIARLDYLDVVGKAENGLVALEMIRELRPDIIFLDVQMPVMDGFDLVMEIRKLDLKPAIIFVTAFSEYAINAIRVSAFDYLLKPISFDELSETIGRYKLASKSEEFIEKVEKLLKHINDTEHVTFHTRTSYVMVPLNEVVYCEADVNYSTLYMTKSYKEVVTVNIGRLEQILNRPNFFRLGRSFIINLHYLNKIDTHTRSCHLMKNGERFVIKAPLKNLKEVLNAI